MSAPVSMCLICLSVKHSCWKIHDIHYGNDESYKIINAIFQIEVNKLQEVPMICVECNLILSQFYVFYKKVKDDHLKCFGPMENYITSESVTIKTEVTDAHHQVEDPLGYVDSPSVEDYKLIVPKQEEDEPPASVQPASQGEPEDAPVEPIQPLCYGQVLPGLAEQLVCTWNPVNNDCGSAQSKKKDIEASVLKAHLAKATKMFLSKYTLDQIFSNDKWLLNEEERDELLTWYVDMKCDHSDCSDVASFGTMLEFEEHAKNIHSGNPILYCCGEPHREKSDVLEHVLAKHIIHNERVNNVHIKCPICGELKRKKYMKIHLSSHLPNELRNYQCDICGFGAFNKSNLQYHIERHNKMLVPCDVCGKKFKDLKYMKLHKERQHEKKPKKIQESYLCPECGKTLKSLQRHRAHLEAHHKEEAKVKCTVCDKLYKASSMTSHMKYHARSEKKQCPQCPFKSHSLSEHIKRVHDKVRPHACTSCSYKCLSKSSLEDHIAACHTGIPRHACSFCDKMFMCNGNRFAHQKRMHPNELAEQRKEKAAKANNVDIVTLEKGRKSKIKMLEGEALEKFQDKIVERKKTKLWIRSIAKDGLK